MMAMHPVRGIDIAAGERVALEPGSFHVMLIGSTEPLIRPASGQGAPVRRPP